MIIERIIKSNRSFRRFHENRRVGPEELKRLVNLARLSPSASNLQPLKFIISCDAAKNGRIFPALRWAGYLKGWGGPAEGERPSAYILILGDKEVSQNFWCDHGIAAQSILLGARSLGLGGCIIGSVNAEMLRGNLQIPPRYEILLVIALGKPKEKVVIEDVKPDGDIKYWRDDKGVHHVPKRSLEDIILKI